MKRRLLLILPALQQLDNYAFRLIKYSRFPPLSLLTIAGMTPEDEWDILVRDEHIESSEVEGHVDLVGIKTYISCAGRAYELSAYWRARGAKVVLGGLHPTSLPAEAIQADAICTGLSNPFGRTYSTISRRAGSRGSTREDALDQPRWSRCRDAT
jgi:hypothetical protein